MLPKLETVYLQVPAHYGREKSFRSNESLQMQSVDETESIHLMLFWSISKHEREHLFNLARKTTRNYQGSCQLRTDLQHLWTAGLISPKVGRSLDELVELSLFDLADYVELNRFGRLWIRCVSSIEPDVPSSLIDLS